MKSLSCPCVSSISGTPCEYHRLVGVVTVGAAAGDGGGDHDRAMRGLEQELPEAVVAVLGEPPPEVHGQELVLRVAELRVAGDDPRALEAEPLVRPDALLLRAHDDVLGPEPVHHEV